MAKTLFSPPRNKPKLSLARPTLAVGQPMPQVQTINRPVNLVDDEGNVHGRLGENPNGPEQVTVSPPPGPTNDPAGGPNYASGGTLLIGGGGTTYGAPGGYDPQNTGEYPVPSPSGFGQAPAPSYPNTGEYPVASNSPYRVTGQAANWPVTVGGIGTPTTNSGAAPVYPPQPQQIRPTMAPSIYGDPNQALYTAQQGQIQSRNAALDMRARVLDLKGQTQPYQQAVYDARGQVIQGQSQQNQMQKGYLQQVGQNEKTRLGELEGIYGASQNAPDIINAGEASNAYAAENRRDSAMGVSAPAEVNLPPGYNGPRVAGVRPKIMTQEQRLAEKAGYEDPIRNQQLSIAKNIVDLQRTDVDAAQLASTKAGLSLDEANNLVSQAQLESDYAGIISSRRDVEAQQAGEAPFPGAVRYTDPQTGQGSWVTPQQQDQLQVQYNENVAGPYRTQVQGQGNQYAGLSDSQLLNTIPPSIKSAANAQLYTQPVRDTLIQRYMQQGRTYEQAVTKADALIQEEFDSRSRSGGTPLVLGATSAAQGNPATANTQVNTAPVPDNSGGRYSGYTAP